VAGGEPPFSAVCWGDCGPEQLANTVVAAAANAARPNSRRLKPVALSALGGAGAHVPHAVVLQLPQVLAVLLMTFSGLSMTFLLSGFWSAAACCRFQSSSPPILAMEGVDEDVRVCY
jgi:hypothetical protein